MRLIFHESHARYRRNYGVVVDVASVEEGLRRPGDNQVRWPDTEHMAPLGLGRRQR